MSHGVIVSYLIALNIFAYTQLDFHLFLQRDYVSQKEEKAKRKKKGFEGFVTLVCFSVRIQSFLHATTPIGAIKGFTPLSLFVTLLFHSSSSMLNCHVL